MGKTVKSGAKWPHIWYCLVFVFEIYEEEVKGQPKDSRGLYLQIDPIFGL